MHALILSALFAFCSPAFAGQLEGVQMPDQVQVEGKTLALNGMGIRKATFLKVKVYVAGLYLEKKTSDPQAILGSPGVSQVRMVFVRDVDAGKMRETWKENFEKNCSQSCDALKPEIQKHQSMLTDIKKGDTVIYTISLAGVEVSINGQSRGKILNTQFAKLVLTTWLGKNPPNEELKAGMLGLVHGS
jgi:hypothetical protein